MKVAFKRYLIIFLCILIAFEALSIIKGLTASNNFSKEASSPSQLKKYADQIVDKCKTAKFAPDCYDKEVPKLMDPTTSISMEDAFTITRYIQSRDPRYNYCHVLAHNVAAKETKKNLANWKDVITRCPYTVCNNGCSHGSIMERYKAESLTDEDIEKAKVEIRDVCEPRANWRPRKIEISMCYHALGHLNMYITNADLNKSIELCRYYGKDRKSVAISEIDTCIAGAFMSVFQPLEAEDIALVKNIAPKREKVASFCAKYTGDSFVNCHIESWPLFTDLIRTPQGLLKFCSFSTKREDQEDCIGSLMNANTVKYVPEPSFINNF